jgi:hypothetical protein
MSFNQHYNLQGKHAFLSASKYSWIRYTPEDLAETFRKALAAQEGTELHELAATLISKGLKLRGSNTTMAMYVNDAIGFRMTPEQVLYYSDNCFGTADAISFRNGMLRIHDLKTGESPAKFDQLKIYAAIFCHEYKVPPGSIDMEFRIYQMDDIKYCNQDTEPDLIPEIVQIMSTMEIYSALIDTWKEEAEVA